MKDLTEDFLDKCVDIVNTQTYTESKEPYRKKFRKVIIGLLDILDIGLIVDGVTYDFCIIPAVHEDDLDSYVIDNINPLNDMTKMYKKFMRQGCIKTTVPLKEKKGAQIQIEFINSIIGLQNYYQKEFKDKYNKDNKFLGKILTNLMFSLLSLIDNGSVTSTEPFNCFPGFELQGVCFNSKIEAGELHSMFINKQS